MVPPDAQPVISTSKSSKDYVTAHKISLLVLIKEFCHVKLTTIQKRQGNKTDDGSWDHTNQQNRDFASTMLKLIQNPDMDLKRLINIIHPIMHPQTYQQFITKLETLRKNGVAAIMDYIATLDSLLTDAAPISPVIQKSSILGLFIRHMLLAFDKLAFSMVTKLCHKFHVYFDAAFSQCLDDSTDINSIDLALDDKLEESYYDDGQVFASQKQAEFFIAQQAALLQINESAALSPYDLQQKIKELLKGNPELYEACYLSFLNCVRVREYCGARENLYHHFDRNTTVPQESKTASEDLSRSSRYAALNLAILHSLFGHKEEAIAALNEAIMVAQEVNDNVCLQYSLAWLYRLSSENKEVLIERSIAKSTDLGLWCLTSLGIQSLTKLKSLTTAAPSSVFDLLTKSDVQNCQHSMADLLGPAYALRAGLWCYYGHSMMTHLSSEMLLFLNTADPVRGGTYHIGEGTCLALRNLAMSFASEGHYVEASQVLSLARELFPPHSEHSGIWQLADLLIKFDRALWQGRWQEAGGAQRGIALVDSQESQYRRAQLLLRQGSISEAEEVLKKLIDHCESNQVSPHFHVRVLLLRVELLMCTPNNTSVLPSLMHCLAMCRNHHLLHLESLTILQVASIQLEIGLPKQALSLLDEIFISVLTHGSQYDKGSCCFLYGRCLAMTAIHLHKHATLQSKELESALIMSNKALEHFKKVKAYLKMKEILVWQAYIYNYLGLKSERNAISYRYRNFDDEIHDKL